MFVVIVDFLAHSEHAARFEAAMLENAAASRLEPGCLQFDVCRVANGGIYLYEVYLDEAAFDAHCASPHFKYFSAEYGHMVASKRVQTLTRISP
jgi:autoinducer 2-degrading protein